MGELERQLGAQSETFERKRLLAKLRKLTREELHWYSSLYGKYRDRALEGLDPADLEPDERREFERLQRIMDDPDAPDGALRDEWSNLRRFLNNLGWIDNSIAPIVRRGMELFVQRREKSSLPEDVELVAQCRDFLRNDAGPRAP